ncbi:MAG: hypothetical protein MJZ04_04205 [Bacteroidales bacterium]|nr:hypothetical protein [Candidatus Cryptobacteroides onthequi]MCQ2164368.1 hypothetical protein [Bacteroidales bacterium]
MRKLTAIITALVLSSFMLNAQVKEKFKTYEIIPKGEKLAGLQFAYLNMNSENSEYLLLANGLDAKASFSSLSPMIAYAISGNHVIGGKISFSSATGSLDATTLSLLNDGLDFDLSDISASLRQKSLSVFYRTYLGLEEKCRFGLFYEYALSYGYSRTAFSLDGSSDDWSDNRKARLSFSPGLVFFPSSNISTQVSVSLADVTWNKTTYVNDGDIKGTKTGFRSQLSLDLLGISFGLVIHI